MYSKGKGIADSALPYKRTQASWVKQTSVEVEADGASGGGGARGVPTTPR